MSRKIKHCLWLFLSLFVATGAYAQRKAIADSILRLPDKDIADSIRLSRLNAIGWNLSTSNPEKSLEYAERARILAIGMINKHAPNKDGIMDEIAASYNTFGKVSYLKADFSGAAKNFLSALAIYEHDGNTSKTAGIYNNLGSINVMLHNFKEGETYLQQALKIRTELCKEQPNNKTFKRSLSKTYSNLGSLFGEQGKSNEALPYYQEALKLNKECGDVLGVASAQGNIGQVFLGQKKIEEAYACFREAYEIFLKMEDKPGIATSLNSMGEALSDLKRYEEGIALLKEALKIEKEEDFKDDEKNTYISLSELYQAMGNYKLSTESLKELIDLKDSLLNEKINKQAGELNEKYKSVKKQAEIDHLQEQQRNDELASSKQKQLIYLIAFVLVMVAILALVLMNRNRIKQRANLDLGRKNQLIESQKNEVEHQKTIIEEKQKEMLDSILYARRIQSAVITSDEYMSAHLKDYFIFYQPKDIVSGDFYWALSLNNRFYLLAGDCTGHGVPGAFMSLLMISILNEIVIERGIVSPDTILNEARKAIIKALNPAGHENVKDGMDCILCAFDFEKNSLEYVSANNNFYIIRKEELILCPCDKMPVGKSPRDHEPFTLRTQGLEKGDVVYVFTDGLADQFGGPKGKKFKYKQLQEMVTENVHLPMPEQQEIIHKRLEDWRGNLEQVDDILLIGLRI